MDATTGSMEQGRRIHIDMMRHLQRTTVQRAYLTVAGQTRRTLVDNHGRMYIPTLRKWVKAAHWDIVKVRGVYERWQDVPEAWLGFQPWFR